MCFIRAVLVAGTGRICALLVTLGVLAQGCGRNIGDECAANVDCATDGRRQCIDATHGKNGYCTIEGCDATNCPEDSTCVRFYPVEFATRSCDPAEEAKGGKSGCWSSEHCTSDALCVPRANERRLCMRTCSSGQDCRQGLECRPTGIGGAERIPTEQDPHPAPIHFCFFAS